MDHALLINIILSLLCVFSWFSSVSLSLSERLGWQFMFTLRERM